ncbi:MAG: glycosyltransferase family 4 protein [Candidatus Paceibacterota bacterium]
MRILIATGVYAPQIGGPATYVKILERLLPQHGISVKVVPFNSVSGFPVIIRHILFAYHIFRLGKKADVIYALDPISVGVPSALIARILGKRFFVRIAGDYAWEQGVQRFKVTDHLDVFSKKNDDYLIPVLIIKKLQKTVAQYAESVIVPSKYFKGVIENWGVDAKKIQVIYSVAEEIPFQGKKADLRNLLMFKGKIVASAGRLVPWKGFEALIEIVPRLIKRYPSFKLLIAGDGPEMEKLSTMVSDKKLDAYVALTGNLESDVLFKYIRVADVFVLNTNYEGLSHQLLEVMAIGTPIITTDIGGNPELIDDSVNGLLVDFNNTDELYKKIITVLDSQDLSEKLVRNAKTKLKKFNPDDMVKELVKEFTR